METTPPPVIATLSAEKKRHCIRIKARIKIQGEQEILESAEEVKQPYQAYCETVSSSRPQSPDVFTTPPTHSEPFQPVQTSHRPTKYTARITTRRAIGQSVAGGSGVTRPQKTPAPVVISASIKSSDQDVPRCPTPSQGDTVPANRYHRVSQSTTPRDSHLGENSQSMSRNHTPSLLQTQNTNNVPGPSTQTVTIRTPTRQKRYGRMNYHPLPPLPPSPPDTPVSSTTDRQDFGKTTVNFSRGEIKRKPAPIKVPHLHCADYNVLPRLLPPVTYHGASLANATAGHERPDSKLARRTVTFADVNTLSSRSSSPDYSSHARDRTLRQSKSFSSGPAVRSSLRQCRSHDSLLAAGVTTEGDARMHASRRTAPKDFTHRYAFGQRPASRMASSSSLGRSSKPNYNPRLSTSKAQYRGLATLPRPLPSSLRVAEPHVGPRQPPWGSLNNLEERRERRIDARERNQVKQFRAATLSEATTLGSSDSFGREKMKKEVEEYKEQVMSVYPDMAFDGNAGKGGRSCCCAVM